MRLKVGEDGDSEDEGEGLFGGMSEDGRSRAASTSNGVGGRHHDSSGRGGSESTTNTTSSPTNHDGDGTIYDPRQHRVPKCLQFVRFPPVFTGVERKHIGREKIGGMRSGWGLRGMVRRSGGAYAGAEELDLDEVETINIDQSQGLVLSVKEGKIFTLRYE